MSHDKTYCQKRVRDGFREHRCTREAIQDGFCKQHHPSTIAAKRKGQEEKWTAERMARERHYQRETLKNALWDEIKGAEPEMYDSRLSYVSAQIDRVLWDKIQAFEEAHGQNGTDSGPNQDMRSTKA